MDTKRPVPTDTQTTPKDAPVDEVPSLEAILASEKKEEAAPARAPRGFAAMDPALVREIARRGARASHEKGTAHKFTADEARAAGRKGGSAPHRVRGRGKRSATRPGA